MASSPRRVPVASEARGPGRRPAGLRVLVPGYPQWGWRQPERAAVFFGTFAGSLTVGLFAWGSRAGLAMLALAFVAHVASAADTIRQAAFPGFGRWVPTVSASCGLGLGCYVPALALASGLAWPDRRDGLPHEGYLINRWAYRATAPSPGDWVWYRLPGGGFGLGRLVAGAGGSVEWTDDEVRVDGRALGWSPITPDGPPVELSLTVPEGRVLIAPAGGTPGPTNSSGLALLPRDALIGRAWARSYPIWRRNWL